MIRNPKSPIRAVFFDIGNVLLRFEPGSMVRKFVSALKVTPRKALGFVSVPSLIDPVERGTLPPAEIYARFRKTFDYRGTFEDFRILFSNHFFVEKQTVALMRAVARTRKVYLLSNTNKLHYDYILKRYSFPRHVHGAFLSYKLGLRKPEPAIYKAALKGARVAPHQAVFIDDLRANVLAARKLGIHAIHHPGPKKLRQELADLGIL